VQIFSGYDRRKKGLNRCIRFYPEAGGANDMQAAFDRMVDFIRKKLKKLLVVEDNTNHNRAIRELIGNGMWNPFRRMRARKRLT